MWRTIGLSLTLCALLPSFLAGCGFYREKPLRDPIFFPDGGAAKISYQFVRKSVFQPNCIACHGNSGGINLETYASIKTNLSKIQKAVFVDKTMPKGRSLSTQELKLLDLWLKAGAPENSEGPTPILPPEPSEPLVPTFKSIKKRVFDLRCISCHSGATPKGDLSFESLQTLLKSSREPLKMEDEGDPSSSGLGIAISRQDDKRMPPPAAGPPLSQIEIDVIKKWIKDGVRAEVLTDSI